jgi:hypothetical protein
MNIPTEAEVQETLRLIVRGCLDGDARVSSNACAKIESWFHKLRQQAATEQAELNRAYNRNIDLYHNG